LAPLVGIWELLLTAPEELVERYAQLWQAQQDAPRAAYDAVRAAFNRHPEPAQLLYLLTRCVKNSPRFNREGHFNQSPDNRRLGMRPAVLRERVAQAHRILKERTSCFVGDYSRALALAQPEDLVYLDPPYMGVSGRRDGRYHQGLDYDRFINELSQANRRELSFMVSFDGRCGDRSYGPGLPESLGLYKIELHLGRSSQATLNGRVEETVESIYLSTVLWKRLDPSRLSSHASRSAPHSRPDTSG
jgi:DNA adenine methylase